MKPVLLSVLCLGLLLVQKPSNLPAPSKGNQGEDEQEQGSNEQGRYNEDNTILGAGPQSEPARVRTLESENAKEGDIVERVRNNQQKQGQDQKNEMSTECRWQLRERVRSTPARILNFLDSNGPIIMVIATIIMTVFTALLVYLAWKQHRLNKVFLKVSTSFFYMANRPRLRIRHVKSPNVPTMNRPALSLDPERFRRPGPKGYFEVINIGGSVAMPTQMYIGLKRTNAVDSAIKLLWKDMPPVEIGIGERYKIILPEQRWPTQILIESSHRALNNLRFFGGIRYKDAEGAMWETGFCRKYDFGRGGFIKEVDNNYEYEY